MASKVNVAKDEALSSRFTCALNVHAARRTRGVREPRSFWMYRTGAKFHTLLLLALAGWPLGQPYFSRVQHPTSTIRSFWLDSKNRTGTTSSFVRVLKYYEEREKKREEERREREKRVEKIDREKREEPLKNSSATRVWHPRCSSWATSK